MSEQRDYRGVRSAIVIRPGLELHWGEPQQMPDDTDWTVTDEYFPLALKIWVDGAWDLIDYAELRPTPEECIERAPWVRMEQAMMERNGYTRRLDEWSV